MDKKFNPGLATLRPILCFEIVLMHFPLPQNLVLNEMAIFIRPFAVGLFMTISFFFIANHIHTDFDKRYLIKRILRIVIPMIGWAIISYLVIILLYGKQPIIALCWQMLTGHSYLNMPMWFMNVLLAFTMVILILPRFLSDKSIYSILIISIFISFYFQYSGLNYSIFNALRFELKYPLGRVFEMMPYAASGIIIHKWIKTFLD